MFEKLRIPGFYFAPDSGTGGGAGGGQEETGNDAGGQGKGDPQGPSSWSEVLGGLPKEQQQLYEDDVKGLKSALSDERTQRQELAGQLRDATKALEEGSEARAALEKLTVELEVANARADFFEEAVKPEIGCRNPKLAWVAAQEIEAFDRKGNPQWEAIKTQFPELFGKVSPPPAGAGEGTGGQQTTGADMNQAIRKAAGRG